MIAVKSLVTGFKVRKQTQILLNSTSFEVQKGELWAVVGRNGSGKSTLLSTLIGLHPPLGGEIRIQGKLLRDYSTSALAQVLALVTTERIRLAYLNVFELVALGRHPYTSFLGKLTPKDEEIVNEAIFEAGIKELEHKNIAQLSDGEHQKVMIARALAQKTPVLVLDEPTAHLDLVNRVEVFRLLRKMSREQGKTILLSTHELGAALQIADKLILLDGQGKAYILPPEELKHSGHIGRTFAKEGIDFDPLTGSFKI